MVALDVPGRLDIEVPGDRQNALVCFTRDDNT
jgi:hypothetical protein